MPEATTQNIGPYQLVRMLAQGGMAEIWLARHPEHGECVVKRVHPHLVSNNEFLMMFVDEARIAARLNHPGCVEIFDLGKEGETYYIAMEYIDGEDIRKIARQARHAQIPLPRKLAVAILMGACDGLHYAHEVKDGAGRPLNVVHRDVSPQNILVTFDGQVRIVDFGIAKAADQANRTRSGVLKGKYAYMAPEQILGVPIDRRADVFALGVLLYELTTGRRLFKAKTELETMRRITQNIFMTPSAASPGYPPALETIVLKAISNDRIGRYASALEFKEALGAFLEAHRVTVVPADIAAFMKQVFSDRLQAIGAARSAGNPGALLDARFGDESSESSAEGLAPGEASLSAATAEATAIDDEPLPVEAGDLPDLRTDPSPTVAHRPKLPNDSGPIESELAPTMTADPLPEFLGERAPESGLKITETSMPAVHFKLPPAEESDASPAGPPANPGAPPSPPDAAARRATRPTAASMAAVWIPPEPRAKPALPHAVTATHGDARLMTDEESEAEPTHEGPPREQEEKTWYDAPVSDEVSSAWDEPVAARGGPLFAWVVGGVAIAATAFVGALLLSRDTSPETQVAATVPIAVESGPSGADIHLDSLRLAQKTPTVITGLSRGRTYEIRLSFPEGPSWSQRFQPEAVPGDPPTLVHTFPGLDAAPTPPGAAAKAPPDEKEAAPTRTLPSKGKLTLKTSRGARGVVYIDGRRAGKLPLVGLEIRPGKHRVEIRRGKHRKRLLVEIRAGRTTVKDLSKKRQRRRRR